MNIPLLKFALCKKGKWSLHKRVGGKVFAYRGPFATKKDGKTFWQEAVVIEWETGAKSLPPDVFTEFYSALYEIERGLSVEAR